MAATAACNNGDLHAGNELYAMRCAARKKRASSNAFPATEFHTIEAIRDFFKARDMPQFCDRGFHK